MNQKKLVRAFKRKYGVRTVNSAALCEALEKQGYTALQVDWKPAAGGDKQMQEMLQYLGGY